MKYSVSEGSAKNLKLIEIQVEEQPTGEISAGAGIGTNGGSFAFNIKESNWLGKGQSLSFEAEVDAESIAGAVIFSDPNYDFLGNALRYSLSSENNDKPDQGYENTFTKDLNSDGLISGGSSYQIATSTGAINLTSWRGRAYRSSTSTEWDVTNAAAVGSGYQALLEGANSLDGKYTVWTTNSSGSVQSGTDWLTGAQMSAQGYENTFGIDFNNDGSIS